MDYQTKDGILLRNVPDGTPEAAIKSRIAQIRASRSQPAPDPLANLDPTEGMSGAETVAAGFGGALTNLGRGAGQMLGMVSDEEVSESRRMDAPLNKTLGGKIGNIAGNIAAAVPAAFIPGANTMVGAAAVGGIAGALQPTVEGESRALNATVGAGLGVAGKYAGDKAGSFLANKLNKAQANVAAKNAAAVPKNAVISEARKAGYVMPPSQANPSLLNRYVEGFSGKIQTGQGASVKNQEVTDLLSKQALGIADDAPLSKAVLRQVREGAGQAYEAVKNSQPRLITTPRYRGDIRALKNDWSAAAREFPDLVKNKEVDALVNSLNRQDISTNAAVELVKKLRFDASVNRRSFDNPAKRELAKAQGKAAEAIDNLIEQNLQRSGNGKLFDEYRHSRMLIARAHDVEDALDETTGHVSARELAKIMGDKPLSGELGTIGRFAKTFPKAAQDLDKMGSTPGISPLDYAGGAIGTLLSGNPAALLSIGARPAVRGMSLSRPYQNLLADAPQFKVGRSLSIPAAALNSRLTKGATPFLAGQSAVGKDLE